MNQSFFDIAVALREALGDIVSLQPADVNATREDKSGHMSRTPPIAILTPETIDDVQSIMRFASTYGVPVVVRGAGTGLAGGAIGSAGEIVLSTLKLNQIIEISAADELAVVGPGVINGDLNEAARAFGYWFAPDPASRAISTIGGNVATNAGGLLCAKYGVTREAVLGLKVVLADGRLIEMGHRTVKGVTGLDFTALMVGSEGTLGVIVEATVRLRALPRGTVSTIGAYFPTIEAAARAASVVSASGARPAIMELLDERAMVAIARWSGGPVRKEAFVLIQCDGIGSHEEAAAIFSVISSLGGVGELTTDPDETEKLLAMRRSFHPAMAASGTVLIEDVCVPRSALPAMFEAIGEIARECGVTIATVAHAGDGNLHPNFIFEGEEVPDAVWDAANTMFLTALRLGGTLTGEHGVGILKKQWLEKELGSAQLELQRDVKRVFDPNGIMNPGKVF
ncbi:MAG: FAD-binding oxidoreductase [Microbacteriaceae bacterium]